MEECTNVQTSKHSTVVVNPHHNADSEAEMDSDLSDEETELNVEGTRNDTDNINNTSGLNISVNKNKNDQKITMDVPLDSDDDESKYVAGKALEAAGFENDIALTPKEERYVNKKLIKRKITVFSRDDGDTKIVAGKALEAAESEIENARRARFETNRTLYYIGKKTLFVLFALSICCAAIYAAWVLPDYICQKRPEDVSLVPPTEVGLPEIVRIYREESLEWNRELYRKMGNFTPILELVWNEILMKFLMRGLGEQISSTSKEKWLRRDSVDIVLSFYIERSDGFLEVANDLPFFKYPVHAVIAHYTVARIERLNNNEKNTLKNIALCFWRIFLSAVQVAETKPMNLEIITDMITLMREIVEFVRSTESASEDVRVHVEAWCLKQIGSTYFKTDQYKEAVEENEKALKIMDEHFRENTKAYYVYGDCLNDIGAAHAQMGDYYKAKKFYEAALQAYENAEGLPDVTETKKNLQRITAKIS